MNPKKRKDKIRRAIRLVWESLDSHLPYIDVKPESKSDGSIKFQTKCVKEYGELIYILTQLL
jgi:hypothetical protein